jgi:glycosyltransferase involved in cell wall biosynthesis
VPFLAVGSRVALVIPAFNEEDCVEAVIRGFRAVTDAEVVLVNNNSSDQTAVLAKTAGATVVDEARPGYGSACLAGLAYLAERTSSPPEFVVFADADGSNEPADFQDLLAPLLAETHDMVIGSRPHRAAPHSLTIPQRFGNRLACFLIARRFGGVHTDLGPYRAISWGALQQIEMEDTDFGWTVEMQIKAAKLKLRVTECDVLNYARKGGKSKISGTIKGVFFAGTKIISTIFKYQ